VPIEGLHPLQWGIFRIKHRTDRRSGLPIEPIIPFYARYAADIARKAVMAAKRWRYLTKIIRKVEADPAAKFYKDEALTAVIDEDAEHMGLYTQNEAARVAVEREHRVAGVKPKQNGNGQPALTMSGNGNGHATNGHNDVHEHAEKDERRAEASPPA